MISRRTALGAAAAAGPLAHATGAAAALAEDHPFSEAAILADLQALDAVAHLRSGDVGELAIAERTEARLRAAGFAITRQSVRVPFFAARRTELAWEGGSVEVFAQYPVVPTGSQGRAGPLKLWRDATDTAAIAGAVALVMLPKGRHSQLQAQPIWSYVQGALAGRPAALVLITDGPTGETIILNAPYDGAVSDIPIAVLGPKPGKAAIAAARAGGAQARLILDGETGTRESYNISAKIDRRSKILAVSTPRSGWTPAVAERGPGYAAFMAFAAWAPKALPEYSLSFVSTTAHEFDNAGGLQFINSPLAPNPDHTALWVHFGAGFAGRAHHDFSNYDPAPLPGVDDFRFLSGSDVLVPALRAAFKGQPGLEAAYPASVVAFGELKEVVDHGYSPAFGFAGAHLRHHIMTDRLSMTDPAWIRAAATASRDVVLQTLRGNR